MTDEPREVQEDPVVLAGDDRDDLEPGPPEDPYTPEPGARPGERRVFHVLALAFVAIANVIGILVRAAVR